MQTIVADTFRQNINTYLEIIRKGGVIVYPTDTIYGIGGVVQPSVTQQIDKAKQLLAGKHYSIIAPSFQWIHDYCKVNEDMEQYWAQKTQEHGNITVLLPWKASYTDATLLSDNEYIGVRYFTNHRFQGIVRELGQPLITTSANISGHKNIQSTDDLDPSQQQYIDIAINDGELNGSPSTLIGYDTGMLIIRS